MKNITRLKHPEYEKIAFDYLIERYKADPEWFEQNLPDITEMVREASMPPSPPRPSFNLTDAQRQRHAKALNDILSISEPSPQDALEGLEHCAILVQDDFLTPHVTHRRVLTLFKAAFGKSPESYRKNTAVSIEGCGTGELVYHSSLLRGVVVGLDKDKRLVSVTITPSDIREGEKMMSIVGIGRGDPRDDVSINHDDYLAELYYERLHGSDWLARR